MECGDFVNLCGGCHDQGRHSEHDMIKIVSPFAVCSNGCGVDPILADRCGISNIVFREIIIILGSSKYILQVQMC